MTTTPDTATGTARATEYPLRRKKLRHTQGFLAFWLLAPALLAVFGVIIYPTLRTLLISFFHVDSALATSTPFVGLRNYVDVLTAPGFWSAAGRTLYFTVVSTSFELVLGLVVAGLLNARFRGRWLFRTIVVIPWALPTIVNAAMWKGIVNAQYGSLNALLTQLHLMGDYKNWLGDPGTALTMVILADVWKMTPLVAILLLAALQSVSPELVEAAKVDGATSLQALRHVLLPLIVPVVLIVLVLRTMEAFKVFDIVWIMTGGGPANATQTIAIYAYQTAYQGYDFGQGAALGYLIALVIMVLAAVYLRLLGRLGRT